MKELNERIDNIGFGDLKLIQNPSEFCYGVDAVLLADFAASIKLEGKVNAIDLGTNTGIVPLILSHKTDWKLTGVEVQKGAYEMALRNVELNALRDRLNFVNSDIKDLNLDKATFDVVTSNPPYMIGGSGVTSDNSPKMIARHETTADLEDFIRVSSELLKPKGHLFMVHRPSRMVDIFYYSRKYNLEPKEIKLVAPKEGEPANILLVHMIRGAGKELAILPNLFVYNADGSYTDELLKAYEKRR